MDLDRPFCRRRRRRRRRRCCCCCCIDHDDVAAECLSPAFTPRTVNCRRGVSVSEPQRRVLNRRVARACCKSAARYSPCLTHLVWPHASHKTHRGGLGLGGSVHEEAHPCFPCFIQQSFNSFDAGSIYHPLVQLIPSSNHSVCLKKTTVPCAPKFN